MTYWSTRTRTRLVVTMSLVAMICVSLLSTQATPNARAQTASTTPVSIHTEESWKGTEIPNNSGDIYPVTLQITSIDSGQSSPISGNWNETDNQSLFGGTVETYAQAYPGSLADVIKVWGKSPIDRYIDFKMTGTIFGEIVEGTDGKLMGIWTYLGADSWAYKFELNNVTLTRRNLVVVVDGINSSLKATQVQARGGDGQDGGGSPGFFAKAGNIPGVIPFLQSNSATYKNARIIMYSYAGSNSIGQPNAYSCRDTFVNPLVKDAQRLADQINAALKSDPDPNQDITLLGHSQGGLVLLTYITALVANNGSVHGLPSGAHLKYAATFDSPDGGVSNKIGYTQIVNQAYRNKFSPSFCKYLKQNDSLFSVQDMQRVYASTVNNKAIGESASILKALLKGKQTTTKDILKEAVSQLGLSFASFANANDLLWLPSRCIPTLQDFPTTAWIYDGGVNSHIYVRRIVAGLLGCFANLIFNGANHFQVLNNALVECALLDFVNGKTPYKN